MAVSEIFDATFTTSSSLDQSKASSPLSALASWVFGVKNREVLEVLEGVSGVCVTGLWSLEPFLPTVFGGVMKAPEG